MDNMDITDSEYDEEEIGYPGRIFFDQEVHTDNGRVGFFPVADELDMTSESIETKTEMFDGILKQFSEKMELKEPKPVIYYHNRLKDMAILEMGAAFIPENIINDDLYFVVEFRKFDKAYSISIIRLNDRLGAQDERGFVTVWDCQWDDEKKEWSFSDKREVRSKVINDRVYKNYRHYIGNIDKSEDPFIQVASAIHKL